MKLTKLENVRLRTWLQTSQRRKFEVSQDGIGRPAGRSLAMNPELAGLALERPLVVGMLIKMGGICFRELKIHAKAELMGDLGMDSHLAG